MEVCISEWVGRTVRVDPVAGGVELTRPAGGATHKAGAARLGDADASLPIANRAFTRPQLRHRSTGIGVLVAADTASIELAAALAVGAGGAGDTWVLVVTGAAVFVALFADTLGGTDDLPALISGRQIVTGIRGVVAADAISIGVADALAARAGGIGDAWVRVVTGATGFVALLAEALGRTDDFPALADRQGVTGRGIGVAADAVGPQRALALAGAAGFIHDAGVGIRASSAVGLGHDRATLAAADALLAGRGPGAAGRLLAATGRDQGAASVTASLLLGLATGGGEAGDGAGEQAEEGAARRSAADHAGETVKA